MAEPEDAIETEINLQTVCRTCLTERGDMRSVFFSDESIGSICFNNIVTSCTQLRVTEGDGLPVHVCIQCIESVTMAFAFKQQAQRADATLRDYIIRKHPDIQLGSIAEVKLERSQECIEIDVDVKTEMKNAEPMFGSNSYDDSTILDHFDDSDDSEDDKKPLNAFKKEMEGKKLLNDSSNSQDMTGLSCSVCSKVFRTSDALEAHKLKRHPDGYVQCEYCDRRFTKEIYLERHIIATHSKVLKKSNRHEKRPGMVGREKSPEHNGPFVCKFCGYLFQREDQLVTHITLSHDEKCGPKKRGRPSKKDIIAKKLRLKGILETMKIKTEVEDEPTEEFDNDLDVSFSTDPKSVLDDLASGPVVNIQMEMGMEIFREKSTDHYCNMCCKSFATFEHLEKHLRKHIGEKPSICKICDTTFTRMNLLKKHLLIHNTPDCLKDIDVKYKSALLTNHEKVLAAAPESLTDEFLTQVILDDIKSGKVERYINEIKIDHDELHILNDVENDSNDTGIDNGDSESELKKKKKNGRHGSRKYKMHKCALCDLSFSRTNHIIRHMATHNYDYPYKCDICKKVFPNDDILQKHKRMQCENNTKAYQCGTCDMKFTYEMSLNRHILRYHKGESVLINFNDPMDPKREKSFICPKCNKGFYRQENLDKHAKTHMPHEKKFECPICQKKFLRKDNLRTHSRIHEPKREDLESNCLCVYCGRSFSNSSNLIVHMRRHTGEKPYKCDICQKGFPRSSDLQCHRRTHTGEKPCLCTICGKGFSRSNKLVRHMRIHTGQRPYKCTFCDRAFTQSNDLTLHVRRHTGDKPYVCGICGDRFIQGTALQNHRRMQGHYEEVNQPTPFAANSVNNPSRENGANRVARVGNHLKAEHLQEYLPELKGLIPPTLI